MKAKNYVTSVTTRVINEVTCVLGRDNYDCLEKIEANEADIVNLDAGTAYYASINFVSRFLSVEKYPGDGKVSMIYRHCYGLPMICLSLLTLQEMVV